MKILIRIESFVLFAELAFVYALRSLAEGVQWDLHSKFGYKPIAYLADLYFTMQYGPYVELVLVLLFLYGFDLVQFKRGRVSSSFFPTSLGILLIFVAGYIVAIKMMYLTWIGPLMTEP